jgi:hypothetical protein
LRVLWEAKAGIEWQVSGGVRPVMTGRGSTDRVLHLARSGGDRLALAAAAHAAAHWHFGGAAQSRSGLKPVQQALFAVLEDARVETLALRELPGLRELWLPFHAGDDAPQGNGFEALLARLARDLLEPQGRDPHPWIVKSRAMVLGPDGALLLESTDAVRAAASRLGNDIGQMRLPFNPATYVPHAAYRDDGSWLWEPQAHAPDSETTLVQAAASDAPPPPMEDRSAAEREATASYPEWDARIGRYRADWCRVHACEAPLAPGGAAGLPPSRKLVRELSVMFLQLRCGLPRLGGRDAAGDELHEVAAIEACVQRRAGHSPDDRVYRRRGRSPWPLAVQLLVDASESTAHSGHGARPLLADLLTVALASAEALDTAGHRSAILSFCSRGRERVEVRGLKAWHERATAPRVLARCAGQRSGGSTRTGAAVRHAAHLARGVAQAEGLRPVVLVLTDGEVHDVDAPDPAYLRGDLRQAIAEAHRSGVGVACAPWKGLAATLLSLLAAL